MALTFVRAFTPQYGTPVRVSPRVSRLTADNPGPFTGYGTNSYIVGGRDLIVIDPGPDDDRHVAALIEAIAGRRVAAILLTHTHRDHAPAARPLARATGAPVLAAAPRSREAMGHTVRLDAPGDPDLVPDRLLHDGDILTCDGATLNVLATPGHASNHLAFALAEENSLFSGDHVMAWSTSIVAPPDGCMADYMASLDRLIARSESVYYPGHGAELTDVPPYLTGLRHHRRGRETAILGRLRAGDTGISAMVASIYAATDPALHPAAALSVLAHLEDMVARGIARADGPPTLHAAYGPG